MVFNRFINSFINKLTWFILLAIIGLFAFFGGLWVANAETFTCSNISVMDSSISFYTSSPSSGTSSYYSHDNIRDVVPTLLSRNPSFVDYYGTYSLFNFYQKFNYVVTQQDANYFRIYYQDLELYRSLTCNDIENKFYISSFYVTNTGNGVGYYRLNVGFIYSFYVDIHIDMDNSDIIIDNISSLSDNFSKYQIYNNYFTSIPSLQYYSIIFPFIDTYSGLSFFTTAESTYFYDYLSSINNDFALALEKDWLRALNSTNNPLSGLTFAFSGDLVTPDTEEPDPENPGGADYSGALGEIKEQLEESNSILDRIEDIVDGIGSGINNFRQEVAGGFNDVVNSIGDGIDSIIDWFSETFDSESSFEDWIQDFGQEDNGGISQIITSPLRLIYSLDDTDDCEPLRFSIWDKEVAIPNGCLLWSLATTEISTTYHIVIYGYLTYRILIELFLLIEKLKDPKEREVDTLDL